MTRISTSFRRIFATGLLLSASLVAAQAPTDKPFEPVSGQAGKDVVWVPTPPVLIVRFPGATFFSRMRRKLGWSGLAEGGEAGTTGC